MVKPLRPAHSFAQKRAVFQGLYPPPPKRIARPESLMQAVTATASAALETFVEVSGSPERISAPHVMTTASNSRPRNRRLLTS